jgi:hypothetical protein
MNLVQLSDPRLQPRVAVVEEPRLRLIENCESVHQLVTAALHSGTPLAALVTAALSSEALDYDPIYLGTSDWRLRVPIHHPFELTRVIVSGTGLTHLRSAANRNVMHISAGAADLPVTDSMRMYQWGVEGGRPASGTVGVQPEWFYKGTGHCLRSHGEALVVPPYADDGGEEAEVAGVYVIDPAGLPRRIGFVTGNEFSDHRMERRNYLYLAPSKLRTCAIGPELALDASFTDLRGTVSVERDGASIWSKEFGTGEDNMAHSLANLEHHQFKYPGHRVPDTLHVHFFGADAFSFGEGVELADGDTMTVALPPLGRPLRNLLRVDRSPEQMVAAGRV